jgi:ribose transport system permease protein
MSTPKRAASSGTSTPTPRLSVGSRMQLYAVGALRTYGVVATLVVLVVLVSLKSSVFLHSENLMNIASQWAPAGIMAVGMTFVILTGGFDLSVGSVFSLSAVTAAGVGRTHSPLVAFAAALGVALAIGIVNGVVVTLLEVNAFIATLGSSFAVSGIGLVATGNAAYLVNNPSFSRLGAGRFHTIPYSGMVLAGALVLGGLVLARSVYGQMIYAVGGNVEASRLAGLRTRLVVGSTYALSGLCAGLAGVITASQLSSASPTISPNIVFDVITIVVVGGTSLAGGYGAMWRTAVGLGILATLQNGLNLLDIDPNYQNIIKGGIIVGALALDSYARRLARRTTTRVVEAHSAPADSSTETASPYATQPKTGGGSL